MSTRVHFELPPRVKPAYSSAAVITTTEDDPLDEEEEEELLSMIVAERQYKRAKIKCLIIFSLATILITLSLIYKLLSYENHKIQQFSSIHHPAYEIISHNHLNEYNADFVLLYHKKTRAELLVYLPSDHEDTNATVPDKVFGISFRTKPTDNTGVPHILEHSVLSGSKKYPVKEPFLYLMKGSLHTFLNAMTYNDRTVYPVASRNSKDFINLMSVYLDAVFAPLCVEKGSEWILQKEGWRYEFLDNNNSTATHHRRAMQYKGVVYSEMMGVYSDPDSVLQRKSESLLFPDNTYHFDSGGDPQYIPTLSYENFTHFYQKHYHPSNSKIFLTGDRMDIVQAMDMVDSYLNKYTLNRSSRTDSVIPFQIKHFKEPVHQRLPYSVSEITKEVGQYMFSISWLLNDQHLNAMTELAFIVLDQLLLGNPSSVLRQTLEGSQLGSSIIGNGMSTGLLQMTFAVGMKGVKKEQVTALESLVLKTLSNIVDVGFDNQDIAAAMNSLEFRLREVDSGSTSNGISIFLSALRKWNYDKNPILAIAFENALQALKKNVLESGGSFFTALVRQYLLDNKHRVHVEMYPSATLEEEVSQNITTRLEDISKSLSDDEYNQLVQQAEHLRDILNAPDSPQNISTIPRLHRTDLPLSNIEYPLEIQNLDAETSEATILVSKVSSSNGILYVDVGFDISSVSYDDIELLPIFLRMLKESGTTTMSTAELYRQLGIYTGGINIYLLLQPTLPSDSQEVQVSVNSRMQSFVFLRGKCLRDKLPTLLKLMKAILGESKLDDKETFIRIAVEEKSNLITNLISRGSGYALKRIQARYDAQAFINDKLSGARHLKTLDDLLTQARTDFSGIYSRLVDMRKKILQNYQSRILVSLTGVSEDLSNLTDDILSFTTDFPRSRTKSMINFREQPHPWIQEAVIEMRASAPLINEGLVVSTQVSYVGKGGIAYAKGERVDGSAYVVQQYLDSGYLWETVRAKNGAYGVFSSMNAWDGTFAFISYRDPNLDKTLDAYDQAAISIRNDVDSGVITDDVISTAIIGAIGDIDGKSYSPSEIGWRSMIYWLSGASAQYRQKIRREVLETKKTDFASFANRLGRMSDSTIAVVSSDSIITSASDRNFTIIQMSL